MSDMQGHEGKHRRRILLVDDTEINRDIIGGILSAADFDVDFASNGEAAYEATWGTSYDLVLMDVEMPGMNGFEAAAHIRAREGVMMGVPIAALTATIQPGARHFSFWSGIDAFITKPIAPGVLVHRVSQIIDAQGERANDWKPVWRLGVFAKSTERLDDDEIDGYLKDLTALLKGVTSAIDAGTSGSKEFLHNIQELVELSSLLGFDEVAGVCRYYKEAGTAGEGRNRDPNLLGAIERALHAIGNYQKDRRTTLFASFWDRTRSNLQQLCRGRLPIGAAN